jgi:hypothetical protein
VQGRVRPIRVVALAPARDVKQSVPQGEKVALIEALVAQSLDEALYVAVLNRLPGLNEEEFNAVIGCPRVERATAKLAYARSSEP